MDKLRDRIAEIVSLDRGFKTSIETADAILALPEIRDALGLQYKGFKIVEDPILKPGEMKMVNRT